MKSIFVKAASMNAIAKKAVLAVFVSMLTVFAVQAQQQVSYVKDEQPASVTYMGTSNNMKAFELKYDNANADKLEVSLYNESGDRLYFGTYTGVKIKKIFKTPSDIGKLVFVVHNTRTNNEQRFEASSETKMVEEVLVTKL